jgi:hypothetical protein
MKMNYIKILSLMIMMMVIAKKAKTTLSFEKSSNELSVTNHQNHYQLCVIFVVNLLLKI